MQKLNHLEIFIMNVSLKVKATTTLIKAAWQSVKSCHFHVRPLQQINHKEYMPYFGINYLKCQDLFVFDNPGGCTTKHSQELICCTKLKW